MAIWNKSKIDTFFYFGDAWIGDECVVRIENGEILVEYENDDIVQYRGKENGEGHFELKCQSNFGHATLHGFVDSEYLEGFWVENGYRGMWRIKLG